MENLPEPKPLGVFAADDVPIYEDLKRHFTFFEAMALQYCAAGANPRQKQERAMEIKMHIENTVEELYVSKQLPAGFDCLPGQCWDGSDCVDCIQLLKAILPMIPPQGK